MSNYNSIKNMETRCVRTPQGSRVERVEHDWGKQCSWVNEGGSHCQAKKVSGKSLCEVHGMLAG